MTWRTSSHSASGGNCVEVHTNWRTSSYTTAAGNCVEVSTGPRVGVRDTKARDLGHFTVSPDAWTAFLDQLRHTEGN